MKATLKLNGKEYEVEISEEMAKDLKKPKKTGYERVDRNKGYFYDYGAETGGLRDDHAALADALYDTANYYSDGLVAENNRRADILMRKLRRFAVEHRKKKIDWEDTIISKYLIYYNYDNHQLVVDFHNYYRGFGVPYFDTRETARKAIEEFRDELIWYFTEYKDSL